MRIELWEGLRSPIALARALGAYVIPREWKNTLILGVATDSREVQRGDLFVALHGKYQNGTDFISQAVANGAVGVLLAEAKAQAARGVRTLVVRDVESALLAAAAWRRRMSGARVIAVTGSVGKTTTKEVIARVLGNAPRSMGNFNSTLGMPLSLLSLREAPFWVLELGINHPGEMQKMASALRPNIAVLTNVGSAHVGEMGGFEALLSEKLSLMRFLCAEGIALIPQEIFRQKTDFLAPFGRVLSFGCEKETDFCAEKITMDTCGCHFDLRYCDRVITNLVWPTPAKSGLFATLIASAVGLLCGIGEGALREGISAAGRTVTRERVKYRGGQLLVDDSYNASLESVVAALDTLSKRAEGRACVAVLGDMLELGGYSRELHEKVGKRVAENGYCLLLTYGEEAIHIANAARKSGMPAHRITHFPKGAREMLVSFLRAHLPENAAVLFKGSRAMQMGRFFEKLGGEDEG